MIALIWDLFDGVSTVQAPDQDPSDDGVSLGLGEVWRVLTGPMRGILSGFVTIYPFVYHLMAPYKGSTPASPTWTAIEKLLNHWKVEVPEQSGWAEPLRRRAAGRHSGQHISRLALRRRYRWDRRAGGPARHQGRLREAGVGLERPRQRHGRLGGQQQGLQPGLSSASPSARSTKAKLPYCVTVTQDPGAAGQSTVRVHGLRGLAISCRRWFVDNNGTVTPESDAAIKRSTVDPRRNGCCSGRNKTLSRWRMSVHRASRSSTNSGSGWRRRRLDGHMPIENSKHADVAMGRESR